MVAGAQLRRDDVEPLRPPIFGLLAAHRGLVAGAGIITAPGLLADAPRRLEWWFTGARGAPEPLRVNLDPAAPDFYDYTTADWYATPERTREPRTARPYVGLACTNEYAITLSAPVVCGGELAGVVAADLLVASVEERVLPALAGLDRPVALTNADGRHRLELPSLLPRERVAAGEHAARASSVRSWLLVQPHSAASRAPSTSDSSLP